MPDAMAVIQVIHQESTKGKQVVCCPSWKKSGRKMIQENSTGNVIFLMISMEKIEI